MAGGLKMWIMGVAHWATRKTKQKSDLALSYVKYTYMHTKTHTGEISRNQWCVPSCLLHSQTSQLRRHRRKATIFSGPRNSSSLNVTIIEWGPDPEAVSGQLLLRSLVWERWLVQPQSDCLWMQKTSISRVHGSSGGIAHPPHPPTPGLNCSLPPAPKKERSYISVAGITVLVQGSSLAGDSRFHSSNWLHCCAEKKPPDALSCPFLAT